MRARSKRLPGQPGTKALLKIYGDRLVCVRYRYDLAQRKRYKTVELIVDEAPWEPPKIIPSADTIVLVQVAWGELDLARRIKSSGGEWQPDYKLWALRYDQAEKLDLLDRIVELSVDGGLWKQSKVIPPSDTIVLIEVIWGELELARRIKLSGGEWRPDYKLWALRYDQAEKLDLLDRIVELDVE